MSIQLDTAYGGSWIRRIRNWSCVFSYEELTLIRRISFLDTAYCTKDGENLDKMKEKGDACIFVGYSTQSRAYRVYKKRTRVLVETIHVNFEELPLMASKHITETVTTSNELDLLFSLMFDELLNGTTPVVSKSSVVHAVDVPKQRQQQSITPSTSTTIAVDTC
ncbi:hypothetical protein Tco_0365773 [Tanacetum coccineum]